MARQGATLTIRDSKQTSALIHAQADALKVVADTVGLRRN
ncbi:hypothetical protein BIWAKO_06147 [Bosea sp. BIWAKO-01]|nr:hypothetical protein BIWAKO_06147 [Bosea sp. BIWAKO-01]